MYIARLLHYVESIYAFMWVCEPTSNLRTRHGNNGRTIARAHTRIQAVNPSTNLHIRYANRERRQRVYSQYTNTYIHTYRELVSVRKVPLRWNEEGKSSSRLAVPEDHITVHYRARCGCGGGSLVCVRCVTQLVLLASDGVMPLCTTPRRCRWRCTESARALLFAGRRSYTTVDGSLHTDIGRKCNKRPVSIRSIKRIRTPSAWLTGWTSS